MKGADGNQMGNYDDSPFPIPARSEGLIMCRQVILLILGTGRGQLSQAGLEGMMTTEKYPCACHFLSLGSVAVSILASS
jgi:hypothetical protein